MSGETTITINGTRLSDEESHIIRMAVDTFRAVMAQGIEEKDEGVLSAMTQVYQDALSTVQTLLDMQPTQRIQ
jgi:hypothetical protein